MTDIRAVTLHHFTDRAREPDTLARELAEIFAARSSAVDGLVRLLVLLSGGGAGVTVLAEWASVEAQRAGVAQLYEDSSFDALRGRLGASQHDDASVVAVFEPKA